MSPIPPDSSQHASGLREIPQPSQLRLPVPPPRPTPPRESSLASAPLAGRAEAVQRADSGYSTGSSLSSPSSPISASPSPTTPVSGDGSDLEASPSHLRKPDPFSRYSRAETPVPAARPEFPSPIGFELPMQNFQSTGAHDARAVGPPPMFSSSVCVSPTELVTEADTRYLENKNSSHSNPSQPPPTAVLRQDLLLPLTLPSPTTEHRGQDLPEYPSGTVPRSSSQPPATGGEKDLDAHGGNMPGGIRSCDAASRGPHVDGAGQSSLSLVTTTPAEVDEARIPAGTRAPPEMYSGNPPFPILTPPPKAPSGDGEHRPSPAPLRSESRPANSRDSPPPLGKVAPTADTPSEVLPSRAAADRESPAPGDPAADVGGPPAPSLCAFLQAPPPRRSLISLGLWKHLQDLPRILSAHSGAIQPVVPQEVPAKLRVIFGFHCKHPAMEQMRDEHGARVEFLEDVWKLADIMANSPAPVEASKRYPDGRVFSLAPSRLNCPCPLQQRFIGTGAISNELADKLCSSFGVDGLLGKLNEVLGTRYRMNEHLYSLLASYVNNGDCDFGRAYGEVRRGWFSDVDRLQAHLKRSAYQDGARRRRAIDLERSLIVQPRTPPRRVWDLYSNRVLPFWALLTTEMPNNLWAVSHSWVDDKERKLMETRVNGREWPIFIPADIELEQVRVELLNLGAEYVWLDVLCLRQQVDEKTRQVLGWDLETSNNAEALRHDEWRLDIPTIRHIYWCSSSQVVVIYFNGLGRPFCLTSEMFTKEKSWFNRIWTMQETAPYWILGGLVPERFHEAEEDADLPSMFHAQICNSLTVLAQNPPDLFALAGSLQRRCSGHPIDFVSALGFLLECRVVSTFDTRQPCEGAWDKLLQQMSEKHRTDLLAVCPVAGDAPGARWRPSCTQLMERRSIPPWIKRVDYAEGELLRCNIVPRDPVAGHAVVYWNCAYLIESCRFAHEPDGTYHLHAMPDPVNRPEASSYKATSFRVQAAGARFDWSADYAAVGVAGLEYWVLGKILDRHPDLEYVVFEKVAVFQIPDVGERERLWRLNPGYSGTPIHYL